ncbi:hypothetical protein [Pantoea vagans]|uniref:hypothetical protein n=1 Tax=Pantoea vagans TaxID=470934 RepID=UPI0023AF9B38|nr:hypothetical protein [Pantoea vagans]MDE8555268.1 hypothetical protein [Pantoea vagans]MDE8575319.1 hypothetical protein [Pantoea vagans]
MFYQKQCPGWWYATLRVPITLFSFTNLAIERTGLIIAPVRFWQQYHNLAIRHQSGLLVLYHLLITLMVLPLAMIYFIWLRSTNNSSRIDALRKAMTEIKVDGLLRIKSQQQGGTR